MRKDDTMKIKEGFIARKVGGQFAVVATGEASRTFNGVIHLNGCGGLLFSKLEMGTDRESMVQAVLDIYEIDRATAETDVDAFVASLKEAGVLDD